MPPTTLLKYVEELKKSEKVVNNFSILFIQRKFKLTQKAAKQVYDALLDVLNQESLS